MSLIHFSCKCNYSIILHNKTPIYSAWGLLRVCAACTTPRLNQSYELRPPWEQHLRYVPQRVRNGYNMTSVMCRRNCEGRTGKYSCRRSRYTGNGNRREMMKIRCNTELRAGHLWILKAVFPFNWHPADRRRDKRESNCGMRPFYEMIHTSKLPLRTGLNTVIANNTGTLAL